MVAVVVGRLVTLNDPENGGGLGWAMPVTVRAAGLVEVSSTVNWIQALVMVAPVGMSMGVNLSPMVWAVPSSVVNSRSDDEA